MRRGTWSRKPLKQAKRLSRRKERLESIQHLKMRLWTLLSEYVRRLGKGVCFTCGKVAHWRELDCGHFRHNSERNSQLGGNELWWFLKNFASQCFTCNRMKSGKLDVFALKLETKYGYGILQEINKKYHTPKKWTREEVSEKIAWFEKELADML